MRRPRARAPHNTSGAPCRVLPGTTLARRGASFGVRGVDVKHALVTSAIVAVAVFGLLAQDRVADAGRLARGIELAPTAHPPLPPGVSQYWYVPESAAS